jgi:hypothetical protein
MTLLILAGALIVWLLSGVLFWLTFVGKKLRFRSRRPTLPAARPPIGAWPADSLPKVERLEQPSYRARGQRVGMLN